MRVKHALYSEKGPRFKGFVNAPLLELGRATKLPDHISVHQPHCQGITPSNSKGGLPAPEAGAHAEEGGIRDEVDLSPSRSVDSQDKAETQSN